MKPPYQTVLNFKTESNSSEDVVYLKLHLRTEAVGGGAPFDMSSQPLVLSVPMAQALVAQLEKQLAVLLSGKGPSPEGPSQTH